MILVNPYLLCICITDRIAMSVGRVRFMPPSPNGGLYPDLSLIEDSNEKETMSTTLENQSTRLKVLLITILIAIYNV